MLSADLPSSSKVLVVVVVAEAWRPFVLRLMPSSSVDCICRRSCSHRSGGFSSTDEPNFVLGSTKALIRPQVRSSALPNFLFPHPSLPLSLYMRRLRCIHSPSFVHLLSSIHRFLIIIIVALYKCRSSSLHLLRY